MVALAGFAGLFCGCLITFFTWKMFFDAYSRKATRIIRELKRQKADARTCNIEVIHRHEFVTPEQVEDLKFGG